MNSKCNYKHLSLIITLLLTILFSSHTLAQSDSIDQAQFVVIYDFQINTTDKNGNAAKDSMQWAVVVGSHVAKCTEFNRVMGEDFGEWKEYGLGEFNARKYNLPVIFVGYPDGEISSFDKVVPNRYFYTEPLPDFGWKLMDDTLTVGGYLCQKAVGKYAGRTWTAWYSEEVAASFGPWKLRGLPGMILKAEDKDGIFLFDCVGLIKRSAPIKYFSREEHTTLKRNKFIAHRNKILCDKKYVKQPNYYIPQGISVIEMWGGGPEPSADEKLSVVSYDMVIPKKVNAYQPLELE